MATLYRVVRFLFWSILGVGKATCIVVAITFTALSLSFCLKIPAPWPLLIAALTSSALLLVLCAPWSAKFRYAVFGAIFGVVVIWYSSLKPMMEAEWLPDVAVLPQVSIHGDIVTVSNIRNFEYRSETDFTPRYYTRQYSLANLQRVDLYVSRWGPTLIAHTITSFDFGPDGVLAVSIETRKKQGESYSAVRGLFKVYELMYVVADERDVIGLRTEHRNEEVRLYRLRMPLTRAHSFFLSFMETVDQLSKRPRFYNALLSSCTSEILVHLPKGFGLSVFSDPRLLLNGRLEEFLYAVGSIDNSMPLQKLMQRSLINQRVHEALSQSDFSTIIREGLPLPVLREE